MEANNDQHPMKGKQTPGTIVVDSQGTEPLLRQASKEPWYTATIAVGLPGSKESKANAHLYAEAHNVANEKGLWPREMSDRLAAAEEEIKKLRAFIEKHHPHAPQCAVMIEPVLAENFCSCGRYALLSPEKANEP